MKAKSIVHSLAIGTSIGLVILAGCAQQQAAIHKPFCRLSIPTKFSTDQLMRDLPFQWYFCYEWQAPLNCEGSNLLADKQTR